VLTDEGYPVREMGVLESSPQAKPAPRTLAGAACPECGNATLIHKDGCDFCTACGYVGHCG
jgi:ribonucleoside-diphosphate reductase alpha chain